MGITLRRKERLLGVIIISGSFCLAEIAIGVRTQSLALIADAFHYMNDLVAFIVSFYAVRISESGPAPQDLTFGYQRAQLLGAFFNGVFLVALGISILVQSLERFIHLERVNDPELMLVMGCVGLTLNIISALFLHEHHGHEHGHGHDSDDVPPLSTDEQQAWGPDGRSLAGTFHNHAEHRHNTSPTQAPGRDLGMVGVLVHVISDALNNIGVIIAALVIWRTNYHSRYFADPGASMGIAIMILLSSIPLVKNSGAILLQSAPRGVDLADIKHDLEKVPGIESVHELHVWRLDQRKAIATAHVVVSNQSVSEFMEMARTVRECLHAYGIHSTTIQPELALGTPPSEPETLVSSSTSDVSGLASRQQRDGLSMGACHLPCGKGICENLKCCSPVPSVQL
ncbi:hypothetical protein DL546_008514 [Coniochaeta pulveracea]|uniref:Uncharacterized protein n=1 Tax=Coniochaeta pulveracea TaxID=177199 RepID=A0A420YDD6_9PEZI|nr:hypothetical protein DL546_008514 [Coniochaeta pulveracea]